MSRIGHILLTARAGLAPFDSPASVTAATDAIRAAARGDAVVLAFAVLPTTLELLVDYGDVLPDAFLAALRRGLTARVNHVLGRRGSLLGPEVTASELDSDRWLPLAEAIEARVVAEGLAGDPAGTLRSSAAAEYSAWIRQPSGAAPRRTAKPLPATTVGDVIRVADVPTVVQLSAVRALPPDSPALSELVRDWFLADPRTLSTVRSILRSLGESQHGAGFFVTGLYGAGKSHLLAVLGLLAESAAWRSVLAESHPELSDLVPSLQAAGDRLVVAVSLDEHSPSTGLETILFQAAAEALADRLGRWAPLTETAHTIAVTREHLLPRYGAELDRLAGGQWTALAERDPRRAAELAAQFVQESRLPYAFAQSRVERLGRLLEEACGGGLTGVVFLIDELSAYLISRDRPGLHADAALLQFLGQRAALSPVWVIGALQRQIEDVGDVEHYILRQIKDRYETRCSLSLATAREVLARKALPRRDPASLEAAVDAAQRAWTGGARRADLTLAALRASYPLHPLTLGALEACAERFLAQTRSIVEFAVARVRGDEHAPGILDQPVEALLTPDALWDHFARDLERHPDLRPYRETVWAYWEANLTSIGETDAELAGRLLKRLLVLRLAGIERPVPDLAAALLPASPEREQRVAALLERLRTRGAYVAVDRHPNGDVYRIDLGYDVNETIRRRARSLEATLAEGDGRLTGVAVEACREADFPLAAALHTPTVEVAWRNSKRAVFVALRDLSGISATELENYAGLLASPEVAECAYLFVAEPQRVARQRSAFGAALEAVAELRWAGALVAWLPREATPEERAEWVALVALELLHGDPTLPSTTAGRAVLERLEEQSTDRLSRLANLMQRLYADGEILSCDRQRPAPAGAWRPALAAVAGEALDRVFPRFGRIAPRRREPDPAAADRLITDAILPGEVQAMPTAALAGWIEDLLVPLGVATGRDGEYRIRISADGPAAELLETLPDRPVGLAALSAQLAKSTWGLTPEQSDWLLAALARCGYLTPLDLSGRPVPAGAPLRARVVAVQPTVLVRAEVWDALEPAATAIYDRPLPALDAASQQDLCDRLRCWRDAARAVAGEIRAAVARCLSALGHEPLQWREVEALVERTEALADAISDGVPAPDTLTEFAAVAGRLSAQQWLDTMDRLRRLRRFAREQLDQLLAAWRDLVQIPLPPGDLHDRRESLLARCMAGEALAWSADDWLAEAAAWRQDYAAAYAAWHAEVHDSARFEPYDRFRTGATMRVLANLSRLALDSVGDAEEIARALRAERTRQCRRADLTLALAEHPVCPECRLALGTPLDLRPIEEFEHAATNAVAERIGLLREPARRAILERGLADLGRDDERVGHARLLLDGPTAPERLLPATSFAVIDLLNQLLTARVAGRRSLRRLTERLAGRRLAARQVRDAVEQWLDPTGELAAEDLLDLED